MYWHSTDSRGATRVATTYCILLTVLSRLHTAHGHGRLEAVRVGSIEISTRGGPGYEDDPVPSHTADSFVCRHPTTTPSLTITAGGTFDLRWQFGAAHVGDCALYLSYDTGVPLADAKFFKIANFPECNKQNNQYVAVSAPSWLPSGSAILRWDWYALHVFPNIEFYGQCADVTIASTSSTLPSQITSYPITNPPIYPASGVGGAYRNAFDASVQWFMTGPACAGGIEGNCCDTSTYAYGQNGYLACANSGASGGGGGTGTPPPTSSTPPAPAPTPPPSPAAPTPVGATAAPTLSTVAPTGAPSVTEDCIIYIVRTGDTLSSVANYYTTQQNCPIEYTDIVQANAIADPNLILPDSNLMIPCPGNCCTTNSCGEAGEAGGGGGSSGDNGNGSSSSDTQNLAVAAIVISIAVLVTLVAFIGWYCYRYNRASVHGPHVGNLRSPVGTRMHDIKNMQHALL